MHNQLRSVAESFEQQLRTVFSPENADKLVGEYSSVTVCGMGGSGVVGEFLNVLYPDRNFSVHKSYGLPSRAGMTGYRRPNTLYLMLSYSGETEETLSAFEVARDEDLPLAVVTGGGKLLEVAKEAGVPYVQIPFTSGIPARFSVGYMLNASLTILSSLKTTDSPSQCFAPLESELAKDQEERGRELAARLAGHTVLIYTEPTLEALGLFWKEMLNETAKLPAFNNLVPEMHHNEIESLKSIANPYLLVLHDSSSDKRIEAQLGMLKTLSEEMNWAFEKIDMHEHHLINQLINGVVLSFWTGFALADALNLDPANTPYIDRIKQG